MSSTASNRSDVPSIGWLLGMSAWMLATAIPGSWTAWLGFIVIGIVGKMPRWAVTGGALGLAAIVAALPFWGQYSGFATGAVYIVGMLLALVANPQWLRNRWLARTASTASAPAQRTRTITRAERRRLQRDRARRRREQAQQEAAERRRAEAAERSTSQTKARADRGEATALASSVGAKSSDFFAAADEPAEPIDVNSAEADELGRLPGMTKSKARRMVRLRKEQNGFPTLDAFAAAAGLQPHEIVRLRDAAFCSPPPRGPRSFGRRVDY